MILSANKNNKFKKISFLLWFVYAILYFYLKNVRMDITAGYLSFIGQCGMDLIAMKLALNCYKSNIHNNSRPLMVLSISYLFAFFADFLYNVFLNINAWELTSTIDFLFDLPFLLFITLQMIFWSYVFFKGAVNKRQHFVFSLPYIIISSCLLWVFLAGVPWQIKTNTLYGFFHVVDSIVECVGFILAIFCMSLSGQRWTKYFGTGYLVIVGSDFIIRTSFVSENIIVANPLEVIWVFGLLLQIQGLLYLKGQGENGFIQILKKTNQLQPNISIMMFVISFLSLVLFLLIETITSGSSYLFTNKNGDILVSTIIFVSIVSILVSIKLSEYFCMNINEVESILFGKISYKKGSKENSMWPELFEFEEIKEYVQQALQLKNDAIVKEKELSSKAIQVAHDIRAPLSALEIYTKYTKKSSPDRICAISSRITEIANDLLNYFVSNKLQEAMPPQISKSVFLLPLINEIEREFTIRCQHHRIKISFNIPGIQNLKVFTAPEEFKRALANILNNAMDSLKISSTKIIKVGVEVRSKSVHIAIEDTGCGIPKNKLDEIFQEGFSFNKKDGTGIGLSYVKKAIFSWGASYNITSVEGKGTTFTFILNRTNDNLENKYYLVDDKQSIRDAWELSASRSNVTLETFQNSKDFLNNLSRIDVNAHIYIDHDLNENQTGLELAKTLHERGYGNIYLATGYQQNEFETFHWLAGITSKMPPFLCENFND